MTFGQKSSKLNSRPVYILLATLRYLYCFSAVGEDKVIDVIDVHTQETIVMNVKEFCQAFETPVEERTSTLNCLGLEVSELPLGNFKP